MESRTDDAQILETVDRGSRTAPTTRPLVGARFGRYTILEEIGRGTMATVFTAYDDQLDRKIAIKLIRDRDTRVRREAQAIARVSHPNVLQIYETGTFEGHDFIAMELVDGVTLTTWQQIRSRNVYDLIARYAEAGRGLAAAHRVGVVHRDFKPDNVLIDNNGRVRVGDFGLARASGAVDRDLEATLVSADDHETRDDAIVGTPAYMAPEQFVSPEVDARADQFSLCAALYEAIYGVRPFRGATLAELRASVRAGVLQDPASGASAPPGLRALLRRGLATDPADRWPSLAALLDQLDQLDAQRDPAAAGRERRRLVLAISAAIAIVLGVPYVEGVDAAVGVGPAAQAAFSAAVLGVVGVVVYTARAQLLTNHYHRRMILMVLVITLGYGLIPVLAAGAGYDAPQSSFIAMVAMGEAFLLAGVLITPTLLLSCAAMWFGGIAVALGAPILQVYTTTAVLGLLVLTVSWSAVPPARHILGLCPEPGATRRTW